MAKSPAFQWYPKDCDTDENVRCMDDEEFGFYVRCLNHSWLNNGLPTDITEFARMMHKTPRQLLKLWARVSRCFFENSEKRFVNSRQEAQRSEQDSFKKKQASAAKSRWDNKSAMPPHESGNAKTMPVQCSASPTASPTPSTNLKAKDSERDAFEIVDEEPTKGPALVVKKVSALTEATEEVAGRIWERHPEHRRCTREVLVRRLRENVKEIPSVEGKIQRMRDIDARHARWCASEEWAGRGIISGLGNWFTRGYAMNEPPPDEFKQGNLLAHKRDKALDDWAST